MTNTRSVPIRIGIVGLGNAASMILPQLVNSGDLTLVGAADPRDDARAKFSETYGSPAFGTIEDLLRADVDAIWVATPNEYHAQHVIAAANAGKYVVCEKPMALTLDDCHRMIETVEANGVTLLLGHSKLMQAPIRKMREIIDGGELGDVIQISTWNYNDWLQRPRLAPEVDTDQGGGIGYRQAPHQVDIVRYLAGRPAKSIRAIANRADPGFPTEGNYSALIDFEGGIGANLVYNAYGYFDITDLTWGIGEGGQVRPLDAPVPKRPRLTGPVDKAALYGKGRLPSDGKRERKQPFYGLTVVSCERGVIRQSPDGLFVYDENGCREVACDTGSPLLRDFAELAAAMGGERTPFPDGHWGRATLEVCLALLQSARESREIALHYQAKP